MGLRAPRQWGIAISILFVVVTAANAGSGPSKQAKAEIVDPELVGMCDPGVLMTQEERSDLLRSLRISNAGTAIIESFLTQYHSLSNLVLQWDTVSYSQIAGPSKGVRTLASSGGGRNTPKMGRLGRGVCVHLSHRLPHIEHIADLAHELTHATKLDAAVLRGEARNAAEFVRGRLEGPGGEADAFAAECTVKRQILGEWDGLCAPYASDDKPDEIDQKLVLNDLYSGKLSASLTGETYPVMLARQFKLLSLRSSTSKTQQSSKNSSRKPASASFTD